MESLFHFAQCSPFCRHELRKNYTSVGSKGKEMITPILYFNSSFLYVLGWVKPVVPKCFGTPTQFQNNEWFANHLFTFFSLTIFYSSYFQIIWENLPFKAFSDLPVDHDPQFGKCWLKWFCYSLWHQIHFQWGHTKNRVRLACIHTWISSMLITTSTTAKVPVRICC